MARPSKQVFQYMQNETHQSPLLPVGAKREGAGEDFVA